MSQPAKSPCEDALIDALTRDHEFDLGPAPSDGSWPEDRVVPAALIRSICVGERKLATPPTAVRIRGARVTGSLNLDSAVLILPLVLRDCSIDKPVILTDAKARYVTLSGCSLPGLIADRFACDGSLVVTQRPNLPRIAGGISLRDAQISGRLDLSGVRIEGKPNALDAEGLVAKGGLLCEKMRASGAVRLDGAAIGVHLDADGATLENPDGDALHAEGISVAGAVLLGHNFISRGRVLISGEIGSLLADAGHFDKGNATQGGDDRAALYVDGTHVKGSVSLGKPEEGSDDSTFTAKGEVRFVAARIDGQFACEGGSFSNSSGDALSLDWVVVGAGAFLRYGFHAIGRVSLRGADITGQLTCRDATFDYGSHPERVAIDAEGLNIKGTALFDSKAPGKGFTAKGRTKLSGATIAGALRMRGGRFEDIDCSNTTVKVLDDELASWPDPSDQNRKGKVVLTQFSYDALSDDAPKNAKDRLKWLRRQEGFAPQPYEQLAKVFRQTGLDDDARAVGIAKQVDRRRRGQLSWLEWLWSWISNVSIRYGYAPIQAFAWLVLVAAISWFVASAAAANSVLVPAKPPDRFTGSASTCTSTYPCLNTVAYAVEQVVPIVNFHQSDSWIIDANAQSGPLYRAWGWIATTLGWFLTTMVVAAVGGLVKKD